MAVNKNLPLLLTIYLLLIISVAVQFLYGDSGDKGWLLVAARKWIDGGILYTDIFEVNPPLILWIYALPEYLHRLLRQVQDQYFLILFGLVVVTVCVQLSADIIRLHPEFTNDAGKQRNFRILLFLMLVTFTMPIYFFDREHIFLVLVLPYIIRGLPSVRQQPLPFPKKLAIGIMAGIGFCIKPHCLIVFTAIQLVTFFTTRSASFLKSAENVIIYAIISGYVTWVACFEPAYVTVVVPMAFKTYSVISHRAQGLCFGILALFSFGAAFADFRFHAMSPYRRDIAFLSGVCLSFLLYALANNGWGYTWNPCIIMVLVTAWFVAQEHSYLKEEKAVCKTGVIFVCNLAYVVLLTLVFIATTGAGFTKEAGQRFTQHVISLNDGKPLKRFGTISTDFETGVILSKTADAHWVTRFNHVWMLPKFFITSPEFTTENEWILHYVSAAYAQDLRRYAPEVMLVEDTDSFYSVHANVNLISYLSQFPDFREEWRHYTYAGKVPYPGRPEGKAWRSGYSIYKRVD